MDHQPVVAIVASRRGRRSAAAASRKWICFRSSRMWPENFASRRPGAGAHEAADEVIEVAELLGAGVAKVLLGKAVLADDLPFVTGSIGQLGTKPSYDLMMNCDTLLMIGTSFPYAEFLPKEGQARCAGGY